MAPDVLDDLLRLPTKERARLAHELIRSLNEERDARAPDEWDADEWEAELDRRAAEAATDPASTMTLDEYRAFIDERLAAHKRR